MFLVHKACPAASYPDQLSVSICARCSNDCGGDGAVSPAESPTAPVLVSDVTATAVTRLLIGEATANWRGVQRCQYRSC